MIRVLWIILLLLTIKAEAQKWEVQFSADMFVKVDTHCDKQRVTWGRVDSKVIFFIADHDTLLLATMANITPENRIIKTKIPSTLARYTITTKIRRDEFVISLKDDDTRTVYFISSKECHHKQ